VVSQFSLVLYKLILILSRNAVILGLTEITLDVFIFHSAADDVVFGFVLFNFHVHEDLYWRFDVIYNGEWVHVQQLVSLFFKFFVIIVVNLAEIWKKWLTSSLERIFTDKYKSTKASAML